MPARTFFPLLDQGRTRRQQIDDPYPAGVPWAFIEPHEAQAVHNHDQTLRKLAERGGLAPQEMVAVVEGWSSRRLLQEKLSDEDAITRLHDRLRAVDMDFTSPPRR